MNEARKLFIETHKADVIKTTLGTGLFPSVKMAQMIIESSDNNGVAGNGITARKATNYFGIKAQDGYKGKKIVFNTPKDGQKVSYFRVYDTAKDSITDHTNFLLQNSRYAKNGVFTATTAQEQTQALQNAGYAEGENYASKLMSIILSHNLLALDVEQLLVKKKD